jgi:cytoskeletal protein CcmA (bactofilin family)
MRTEEALRARDVRTPTGTTVTGQPFEERRRVAWIGKSVILRGDVISSEDLMIDGVVEGTIEVGQHSLLIGADAKIKADLVGRSITIGGSITGNVTATEKIDLRSTGSISGDISTPRLAMADGAIIQGRVETGRHTMAQKTS